MPLPDASNITNYGAPKRNYEIAPVDPETDLDAIEYNRLACDVAMSSRMVDRVEVTFTAGATPTVTSFEAVWKKTTTTVPSIVKTGTGTFTLTVPLSVQDELQGSHTVNLKSALGSATGPQARHVQAAATGNVITVYVFDMAGASVDATGETFVVRAR